uniref:Arrestin domain-containing protein 3 n=1 Tax=Fundulus heteroclitus TaxID=8078 RepID=A0A3Q2QEU3_FUNHE
LQRRAVEVYWKNYENIFSEGDVVTGQVTLSLSKETKVKKLFVKAKGDADVRWTRQRDDRTKTYHAHRRYFKLKQHLIPEDSEGRRSGCSIQNMPSSFRGIHGSIVYKLEAKLSRSWRMDSTADKELTFVSKSFSNFNTLLVPDSTEKETGIFSKGQVHIDATVNKTAFTPGIAKVNNATSRNMTPKFKLIRTIEFLANGDSKNEEYSVQKVVDKVIKPHTKHEVRCELQVPTDEMPSIENCDIISVFHQLKVYLDISFAFDPEIIFPLVIAHPMFRDRVSGNLGPYPVEGFGGPTNSDFPPPAVAGGLYPSLPSCGPYGYPGAQGPSAPPPAYPEVHNGPPGAYPPQPPPMYSVPQAPFPYGPPPSFSSSSSPAAPAFNVPPSGPQIQPPFPSTIPSAPGLNPPPSAPDMSADFLSQTNDDPPAYQLLFPPPNLENADTK